MRDGGLTTSGILKTKNAELEDINTNVGVCIPGQTKTKKALIQLNRRIRTR